MHLVKVTCIYVLNNSNIIPKIFSFDFFLFLSFAPMLTVSTSWSTIQGTKIMR